jgi:hypothetical protein
MIGQLRNVSFELGMNVGFLRRLVLITSSNVIVCLEFPDRASFAFVNISPIFMCPVYFS